MPLSTRAVAVLTVTCLPLALLVPSAGAAVPFGPEAYALGPATASGPADPDGFARAERTGLVVFRAQDGNGSEANELWVTDGTPAGTRVLRALPGAAALEPTGLTAFGGRVWFSAQDADGDRELWVSDGTSAGTLRFLDVDPGSSTSSNAIPRGVAAGRLWFVANTEEHGSELWSTDGTVAGTQVHEVVPGADGSNPGGDVVALAGKVYFSADRRVQATVPGSDEVTPVTGGYLDPYQLTVAGRALWFGGTSSGGEGVELFRHDPATGGAGIITNINSDGDSDPNQLTALDEVLVYQAVGPQGMELYATDLGTRLTGLVEDLFAGPGDSFPTQLERMGNRVLFVATSAGQPRGMWSTDGTLGNATRLFDAPDPSGDFDHRVLRGALYFTLPAPDGGDEVFRTSGAVGPPVQVTDIAPGGASADPRTPDLVGNSLLFPALLPGVGSRPFVLTVQGSSTVLRPKASYSAKQARLKRIRVPVVVRAGGAAVDGPVVLRKGTKVVGRGRVVDGRGSVRITVRLAVGRHRVTATYGGSLDARRSVSRAVVVRVVR